MYLEHLSLTNVRSFRRLELALEPGIHVVRGENGSGKTNLLEAIALLATTRSHRAGHDGELIAWGALEDEPLPAARVAAAVISERQRTTLEISVIARAEGRGSPRGEGEAPMASRRFRVNGVARRASDLVGRLRAVMFAADDLDIIEGAPAGRRRYLDVTFSQLDAAYVRALQRYGRVLQQRNSLLRNFQERRGDLGELDFWDDELATAGAVIVERRARGVERLSELASTWHAELSPRGAGVRVRYRPALPPEFGVALEALEGDDLARRLGEAYRATRLADIRRGVTQLGPHRDDLSFLLDGHEAGAFASRGEQRTVALALRLGEVALSTERTGEAPVLLLDDILSELDARRRERVLGVVRGVDQVFITTPDDDRPSPTELPGARRYILEGGELREAPA